MIASPAFAKSPQLARFLTFVVEETLAGRGERLKAYTVATDAFGRGSDFDAQHDPIVRVEAGRLRRALVHYYATDGLNYPIVITLPRGGYTPEFHTNTAPLRAMLRVQRLQRRAVDVLRDNYRLVLMMSVAVIVSIVLDLLGIMYMKSI